ncbi:MAG: T9SS type A sorting domain-containing protein [Prevotella sp.]|nr:T9SS type A sorting domain-containing protein [Prevotella sp.]
MKKLLLISTTLALAALSGNAQLRVNKNGNVSIQTTITPLSPLTIYGEGDNNFKIHSKSNKNGIFCGVMNNDNSWSNAAEFRSSVGSNRSFNVGVKGDATSLNHVNAYTGRAFGVFGDAGFATNGWNYGVFGRLSGILNGAAVYGTTEGLSNGTQVNGRYAGYFCGDVKVTGNLTVNGNISGVILGNEANSISTLSVEAGRQSVGSCGVTDKMAGLSAIPYYKSAPAMAHSAAATGDTLTETRQLSRTEVQNMEKMHYALSADQLEEIYPELVYENEDGSKSINYMEMIPLLVQSINELNAKIARLETANGKLKSNAKANGGGNETTGLGDTDATVVSPALSQNNPNPFANATSIKMTVPQSAATALLCIYDMSGKQISQKTISDRGEVTYSFTSEGLDAGMYLYSLIIDGKLINTRRMILTK